jgi:hypothetical protein
VSEEPCSYPVGDCVLGAGYQRVRDALKALLAWAECAEVDIDTDVGLSRSLAELERDNALSPEIIEARAALAATEACAGGAGAEDTPAST